MNTTLIILGIIVIAALVIKEVQKDLRGDYFRGILYAEEVYQSSGVYGLIELAEEVDYAYDYNDFDRGINDYYDHVKRNKDLIKEGL